MVDSDPRVLLWPLPKGFKHPLGSIELISFIIFFGSLKFFFFFNIAMILEIIRAQLETLFTRGSLSRSYKRMSSFIFGLGSVVFNLCLINSVHVYRRYVTKERDRMQRMRALNGCYCRGCELSLAATPARRSMRTAFADLKYVHDL